MTDEYYLAMAALDNYIVNDNLPKSTSVVFRIHQLGHARDAAEERAEQAEAERDELRKDLAEAHEVLEQLTKATARDFIERAGE